MFDTININLRSIDTQQLNFVKTVTRDLNVDTTTSRYGTTYTSHIDNLTIRTTTQGVSIGNGSLCKFLHGNNIVNFTRTDTRLAFEKLSDTLHVSLNNATVSRMDVAYNFDVTYPPESYFYHLGNLPYYKRLEQMFYKGVEGLYYSSVSDKKQLVFYDKIKETTNRKDYVPPEYQNKIYCGMNFVWKITSNKFSKWTRWLFRCCMMSGSTIGLSIIGNRNTEKSSSKMNMRSTLPIAKGLETWTKSECYCWSNNREGWTSSSKNWTNNTTQGDWINDNVRKSNGKPKNWCKTIR